MTKRLVPLVLLGAVTAASCSSVQLAQTRQLATASARVTVASLPIMAKVTEAYGAPYAGLVTAFAEALAPEYKPPGVAGETTDEGPLIKDDTGEVGEPQGDSDAQEAVPEPNDLIDTLEVQVDVLKERQNGQRLEGLALSNGDTLTENDNYKLQIRCNAECYVYIAQLDSTGRMDPIMPSSLVPNQNPLFPNQSYAIPSGGDWFYLDSNTGVEQIYFIFSLSPRDDIDAIFAQLATANSNLVKQQSVSIEEPMLLSKGIAGVRSGKQQTLQLSNGTTGQYLSTLLQSVDAELVVTRWFRHD